MKKTLLLFSLLLLSGCGTETVILPLSSGSGGNFAAPGSCPAGYVVQNTTSSGVQCVPDVFGNGTSTSTGGNMTMWRLDADTGTVANVTNFTLVRLLSSSGISTTISGFDVFIENTGILGLSAGDGLDTTGGSSPTLSVDATVCRSDGSNCPANITGSGSNGETLFDAPQCETGCNTFYDVMVT
jgi:hypothetical protein